MPCSCTAFASFDRYGLQLSSQRAIAPGALGWTLVADTVDMPTPPFARATW